MSGNIIGSDSLRGVNHAYNPALNRNVCLDCSQPKLYTYHTENIGNEHKFESSRTRVTTKCNVCSENVLHANHRGFDYDIPAVEGGHEFVSDGLPYPKCNQCGRVSTHSVHIDLATEFYLSNSHEFVQAGDANWCKLCRLAEPHYRSKKLVHLTHVMYAEGRFTTVEKHAYKQSEMHENEDRCAECSGAYRGEQHAVLYPVEDIQPPVKGSKPENIAEEAQRIVYGDREQTYDDPNRNFNKLAHMWTGHLLNKLKPGEKITASDVALMQTMLKISREGFNPHRDNRVDMIGYTLCLDRIVEAEDKDVTK